MAYILSILMGYLLGCSNLSYFISKAKGVDIRQHGSGNLGAANAVITMGAKVGVLVAIHDICKAMIAVWLCRICFPAALQIGAVAGVACVIGHIFPFYLKGKGGKGFASFLGMTLALDWKLALIVVGVVIVITWVTDYLVLGSVSASLLVPIYSGIAEQSWLLGGILMAGALLITYKHKDNVPRMLDGTEIGLRRTLTKKDRVS